MLLCAVRAVPFGVQLRSAGAGAGAGVGVWCVVCGVWCVVCRGCYALAEGSHNEVLP